MSETPNKSLTHENLTATEPAVPPPQPVPSDAQEQGLLSAPEPLEHPADAPYPPTLPDTPAAPETPETNYPPTQPDTPVKQDANAGGSAKDLLFRDPHQSPDQRDISRAPELPGEPPQPVDLPYPLIDDPTIPAPVPPAEPIETPPADNPEEGEHG